MEVEIKVEPGRLEPKMVILAGEDSEELRLRFYTDGKGVSAQTAEETFAVRLRLYELEERLDATRFVRISNGEIINLDRVTAVDLSLSGTICMTLDGAVHAYVSRRYVKKIKETLNLGRRRRHEESE